MAFASYARPAAHAARLLIASMLLVPNTGYVAQITQTNPVQGNQGAEMSVYMQNNDPSAIYDSAQLDLEGLAGRVADAVIAYNSSYAGFTRGQVMAEWGVSVRAPPTGEVYSKWLATKETNGHIQLTHSGIGYDKWFSTQDNPSQDLMALTISVPKEQLDFNHNGVFDAETESIQKTTNAVPNAFVGKSESGLTEWPTQGQAYGIAMNMPCKLLLDSTNGSLVFEETQTNVLYTVSSSTNLVDWITEIPYTSGTGSNLEFGIDFSAGRKFYKGSKQ